MSFLKKNDRQQSKLFSKVINFKIQYFYYLNLGPKPLILLWKVKIS